MLKLDVWNIVFTIINLLVLYFIFKKFLFKPVLNVIKEREDKINGQFEEAKKANEDADNKKKEYEDKLIMAKDEADKIVLEARQRAEKEKNQTLESTRKEAQNIMDKAKEDISVKYTISSMAEEKNVRLDKDDMAEVVDLSNEYYNKLSQDEKDFTEATLDDVQAVYCNYELADKVYEKVTEDVGNDISEEDARVIKIQYIRMSTDLSLIHI